MAFKAGGALREVKYTRLYSWQEGLEAVGESQRDRIPSTPTTRMSPRGSSRGTARRAVFLQVGGAIWLRVSLLTAKLKAPAQQFRSHVINGLYCTVFEQATEIAAAASGEQSRAAKPIERG